MALRLAVKRASPNSKSVQQKSSNEKCGGLNCSMEVKVLWEVTQNMGVESQKGNEEGRRFEEIDLSMLPCRIWAPPEHILGLYAKIR